jgi:outer membrane protein assembly factor BamB
MANRFSSRGDGAGIGWSAACAGLLVALAADGAFGQWPQWGGRQQDFIVKTSGLADTWPDTGPKQLWSRDLGDGFSGIIADRGKLFTMYRSEGKEVVVAHDQKSGETIWEHAYDAPVGENHVRQFGEGPRSTPLVFGKGLYTIGIAGIMHCLNKKNGEIIWSTDLWKDHEGTWQNHGYSCGAFPYKDTVIVMVGGKGHSIVALDKKTGKVNWKKLSFENSYSTPKLIQVDGEDMLLCFMAQELAGIDPANGKLKWKFEHGNRWNQNITLPLYGDDGHIFFSSIEAGARVIKLSKKGRRYKVNEVWSDPKVQIYHSQAFRFGDHVYGCSGARGPGIFTCIDVKTGEVAWRERGFSKATCIYADDKFIILDEDGKLGLARATPEEFKILTQAQVLDRVAWTVPTLVDTTLYIRDKKRIIAFDLARDSYAAAEKPGEGPAS